MQGWARLRRFFRSRREMELRSLIGTELSKQWCRRVVVTRTHGTLPRTVDPPPRLDGLAHELLRVIKTCKCLPSDAPRAVAITLRHLPFRTWVSGRGAMVEGGVFYDESTGPDPYAFTKVRHQVEAAIREGARKDA